VIGAPDERWASGWWPSWSASSSTRRIWTATAGIPPDRELQASPGVPLRGRTAKEPDRQVAAAGVEKGNRVLTESDILRLERDAERGVATITLDDPEKHNRVPMAARTQLAELLDELDTDDAVSVIVITGAGERAFSAGGDVMGFLRTDPATLSRLAWNVAAAERCGKPVIAKLRGYVLGVGLELALASDFGSPPTTSSWDCRRSDWA